LVLGLYFNNISFIFLLSVVLAQQVPGKNH
jgi:hypothetical protein